MRFGSVPIDAALGAILAHSVRAGRRLAKGRVLDRADIETLRTVGIADIVVARLDDDDVSENDAAATIAQAMATEMVEAEPAATGRCNLHAICDGLFVADRAVIDAVNAVNTGITIATLRDAEPVSAGRMVATVKIIPFAVPLKAVEAVVGALAGAAEVKAFTPMRVALISTTLPSLKASIVDKTERTTAVRLKQLGSEVVSHERIIHEESHLAARLRSTRDADLIIVFGASAVADAEDVIPASIRTAGGSVETIGMPVDPGNLLSFGHLGGTPVIGAPGCARSPVENGFDWVLHRIAAGLPVTERWVRSLGVGGLLMEIESRPSPREPARETQLSIVVLAAGRSSRMGSKNKLTRVLEGKALVARAVDAALEADVGPIIVVTGHEDAEVRSALADRDVRFVHNPHFADGMSTSLRAGLAGVRTKGAMVVLGDMPDVTADGLRRLAAIFAEHGAAKIVAARDAETGRCGNPVIWPASFIPQLKQLEGDEGARAILRARADEVVSVEIDGAALDLDTLEAFAARARR